MIFSNGQIVAISCTALFVLLLVVLVGYSIYASHRARAEDEEARTRISGGWKDDRGAMIGINHVPQPVKVNRHIPPSQALAMQSIHPPAYAEAATIRVPKPSVPRSHAQTRIPLPTQNFPHSSLLTSKVSDTGGSFSGPTAPLCRPSAVITPPKRGASSMNAVKHLRSQPVMPKGSTSSSAKIPSSRGSGLNRGVAEKPPKISSVRPERSAVRRENSHRDRERDSGRDRDRDRDRDKDRSPREERNVTNRPGRPGLSRRSSRTNHKRSSHAPTRHRSSKDRDSSRRYHSSRRKKNRK